jgi:hypothetical protein
MMPLIQINHAAQELNITLLNPIFRLIKSLKNPQTQTVWRYLYRRFIVKLLFVPSK